MRAVGTVLLLISTCLSSSVIEYVDPFIGTGGEGFGIGSVPPGAQAPFGMLRVGPDTASYDDIVIPFNHFGGYYYGDDNILLFSHTHMVGSGVLDYGTVGMMPVSTVSPPPSSMIQDYGFSSRFSHSQEKAKPGHYGVNLLSWDIDVDLTALEHSVVHKYKYNGHQAGRDDMLILFDISHTLTADGCHNASVQINPAANEVTGWVLNDGTLSRRFGGVTTFFVARSNSPFSSFGTWNNDQVNAKSTSEQGTNIGGYIGVDSPSGSVEVCIGISFISLEQARINLMAEILSAGKTYDVVLKESQSTWESSLSVVEVTGGRHEDLVKFYTGVYHTLLAPTDFTEVGGVYLGFDKEVHQLATGKFYSDMSIWDVHRSEFPWLTLIRPDVMQDIINSLLLMKQQGGDIPRWPLANGYTGCMIGQHADVVITDAYLKGIRGFDAQFAYQSMKIAATTSRPNAGRSDVEDWLNLGYIPFEKQTTGASLTLAYSFDDWAIGHLGKALGFNDSTLFLNRSQNYKNVWNSEYKFFCPKTASGEWECPDLWINVFDERYIEGDAWHWRWFVPHDIPGLIELFGRDQFVEQLTEFFHRSEFTLSNILPNAYYWAGNEPDILAVWMFNWANRPDLTQYYSRWMMEHQYTVGANGLPGNDDYGTMSAWLVFASIGFYPLAGSTTYMIGSPLFSNVTLHIPQGDLVVTSHGASAENIYVQKAIINGSPLETPFLDHSKLAGSAIEFFMGPTPSTWGTKFVWNMDT